MKPSRIVMPLVVAVLAAIPAGAALGQVAPPDLSGMWTLEANVTTEGEELPCVYRGSVDLAQDGSTVNGPANLALVSGPMSCPAELTGVLTGTAAYGQFNEPIVSGSIDGGSPSGVADFNGSFSEPVVGIARGGMLLMAMAMQAPSTGNGSVNVTSGPFAGTGGSWTATSAGAVPTLAPLGLTILVALLLAAGFFVLRRQQLDHAA
jgi:hypothetical protein